MNSIDPCSMLDPGFEAIDQEFSVEVVAAMLAVDTVAPLPAVVTVSNELGEPRYPKLQQIMQAGKKPVQALTLADLGVDAGSLAPRLTLESLFVPVVDTKVELMEGDTPEEQAAALAKRLKEAKLI